MTVRNRGQEIEKMSIILKYAVYEIISNPDSGSRFVCTIFPDQLQSVGLRDETDPDNIRQAESEGYGGHEIVWKSLIDHELLHSIVAEIMFDRPSVVLRTEAGCVEFYPLWERYEEEMLVLGMQIYLNSRESTLIRTLSPSDAIRIANRYRELMRDLGKVTSGRFYL